MLFAAIGDIQGNLNALTAVLDHIEAAGIMVVVHTGNAVVGGEKGNDVVDMLRARDIYCVQGTEDRLVVRFSKKRASLRTRLNPADFEAMERAHAGTHSENLEFLRNLPKRQRIEIDDHVISLSHGSPGSQADQIGTTTPVTRLRRLREEALADVIVCGGAPEPFNALVADTLFVCPGSVEMAPGMARYALVSVEEPPWSATFPEVAYALD